MKRPLLPSYPSTVGKVVRGGIESLLRGGDGGQVCHRRETLCLGDVVPSGFTELKAGNFWKSRLGSINVLIKCETIKLNGGGRSDSLIRL